MAANIVYTGNPDGENANDDDDKMGNSYTWNVDTKTINWNLKSSYPVESQEQADGTIWYTYELEYPVRLDNTAEGFTFDQDLVTNGTTELKYFMFSKVKENDEEKEDDKVEPDPLELKTAYFDVPKVEGYAGSLDVTKTALDEKTLLSGAKFELQYLCDENQHTGNIKTNVPTNISGEDGKLILNNIPSGHIYKLVEAQAPEGYEAEKTAKYAIKVAFGQVSYCELDDSGNLPDSPKWTAIPVAGLSLTNKKLPGSKQITVTKNWVTQENFTPTVKLEVLQDGKAFALADSLPDNVSVQDGHTYINLTEQKGVNIVKSVVTTLQVPQFKQNGTEYQYTVREIVDDNAIITTDGAATIDGQKWQVAFSGNGLTVTNSYIGTTSVSGTKTWLDGDDENRPTSVQVALYANNVAVDVNGDGSVTAADYQTVTGTEWTFTFSNLPKYDANGAEISYSVKEVGEANGSITIGGKDYTVSYAGYNIINLLTGTTSVSGTKTWLDGDDENRPTSVQVALYANNVAVDVNGDGSVTAADYQTVTGTEWTFTFSNLPKYDANGAEISYSVKEVGEANGSITIGGKDYTVSYAGYNIINLLTGTTSVSGTKTWLDGDDENRPTSVQVALYANNVAVDVNGDGSVTAADYQTVTGTEWTFTFSNLPKYDANGAEISYSVKEVGEANGSITIGGKDYTVSYAGYNIINLLTGTTSVSGTKTWLDGDDENRPTSVQVALYANNVAVDVNGDGSVTAADYQTVTGVAWTFTFSNLPKYDANGAEISYSVKEVGEANGSITIGGKDYTVSYAGYNITNLLTGTTSVSGTKTWLDGDDENRPASVQVALYANNVAVDVNGDGSVTAADYQTVTGAAWTFTFSNLPKYDANGAEISYSVKEVGEANGSITIGGKDYTVNYAGYNITNTITQDYVSVSGEKIWKVPTDVEIPESITVQLFRDNGAEPISTTTTAVDWTYSFDNLPKYAVGEAVGEGEVVDGHEYIYTVKEVKVDGFTTKYNGYDIINTYDRSADTEVSVQKRWIDFGTNVTTHSAITIELYQNNVLYDTVQLSDENDWNTTFVELPKYDANQQPFDYTVKEVAVAGYTTTILEVEDNKFVVTNTLMLGKPGEITVEKQTTGDNETRQ